MAKYHQNITIVTSIFKLHFQWPISSGREVGGEARIKRYDILTRQAMAHLRGEFSWFGYWQETPKDSKGRTALTAKHMQKPCDSNCGSWITNGSFLLFQLGFLITQFRKILELTFYNGNPRTCWGMIFTIIHTHTYWRAGRILFRS